MDLCGQHFCAITETFDPKVHEFACKVDFQSYRSYISNTFGYLLSSLNPHDFQKIPFKIISVKINLSRKRYVW